MKKILILAIFILTFKSNSISQLDEFKSRAERSNYQETSLYTDIMFFLRNCEKKSENIKITYFCTSAEQKNIPLVQLSDRKGSGNKIKILVIAGIHSGEVDGKEASFVLIRNILFGKLKYLLKNCSIYIIPTLNMDGNDKIDRYHRLSQNGPYNGVGLADFPNGMNINRDFSKHEIPETEALIKNVINKYDPEIIVDCHTTNGSYHAYALTYAPPLNPNTNKRITNFLRNELFPKVTDNLYKKYNYRTQYYGNFKDHNKPEEGWETFNYRPRYSNNYTGLINKIGILSEGYSYLELKKRIDVTSKFVTEIMDYTYHNVSKIKEIIRKADSDNLGRIKNIDSLEVAVQCELYEEKKPIRIFAGAVDSVKDLNGRGYTFLMKEDFAKEIMTKDFTNFRPSINVKMPYAYVIPAKFDKVIENLKGHGIEINIMKDTLSLRAEIFMIDSIEYSKEKFQAHNPVSVHGWYETKYLTLQKGDFIVPLAQKKSNLIPQLLEPLCDDGYLYWNFFDEYFKLYYNRKVIEYPVIRILSPVDIIYNRMK
jgi:hypothetical protein